MTGPRPVVTGVGVLAPNGGTAPDWWAATLRGRSGLGPLTRFDAPGHPVQVAGQIDGFDPAEHVGSRLLPQTDRTTQLALTASDEAVRDAGLTGALLERTSCGVVTASSSGGFEFGQRELQHLWAEGPARVSAYMSFAWFYAVDSGQLSIRHDLRGPSGVVVNEQAGGLDALGQARRLVRKGTPVVLTGGTDASLCPFGWAAHATSGECSEVDDPARAYLPFDLDAAGYVPGEGGAIMVLEDAAHARDRGATPYATVAGYAAAFDPGHHPDAGLRAATAAIADAGLAPGDIAGVLADGSADPVADRAEAGCLRALFGPYGVPVSAPKVLFLLLIVGGVLGLKLGH